LSVLLLLAGCRTADTLPPADFSAPGWDVRQGQAVWQPPGHRPALAGDLLLATNANGGLFLQFSKIPFSVATARIAGPDWRMEFAGGKYSFQGRLPPPSRFGWFQLPRALLGLPPAGHWIFTPRADGSWRLANPHTGESLEGQVSP
jgi:hypothetical protein